MKRTIAFLAAALAAGSLQVHAQSDVIIKRKARDLRDQNNAAQGVPPPAAPAAPAPVPATVPAAPVVLTPSQQAMIRVRDDLAPMKPGSTVTAAQKDQLAKDMVHAAQGTKPSQASTAKLADGLATALSGKLLSNATRGKLLQNLGAALNPAAPQASNPQDIAKDVLTLLQSAGIDRDVAENVSQSLKLVATETRKTGQ